MQLTHAQIAARIPHQGAMCLLEAVTESSAEHIVCTTDNHHRADNPLRDATGVLGAALGIEYAAQAMALHSVLHPADRSAAQPAFGYLASVRDVQLLSDRLDALGGSLTVRAERIAANAATALYAFAIEAQGQAVLRGRISALLDAALPADSRPEPMP